MKTKGFLKFGFWFLRLIYEPELYIDISGDFEELYLNRLEHQGKLVAITRFYLDVLMSTPNISRKLKNQTYTMISIDSLVNYLKMGYRVLKKNPVTSFISIFGLATAVGCATTSLLWVDFQSNLDSFHKNRSLIYQITSHIEEEGIDVLYGASPVLLAEHLGAEHSEVQDVTRVKRYEANVKFKSSVFRESVQFVDPQFLSMFDFPMIYGNKRALYELNSVVIGKAVSEKYFAGKDPVGQTMEFYFNNGQNRHFVVSGVLDDIPEKSSMKYSILLPFENYKSIASARVDWGDNVDASFVLLSKGYQPSDLSSVMNEYLERQNSSDTRLPIRSFELIPLSVLGSRSDEIYKPIAYGSAPSSYWSMGIMGYLMLVLACINYLNIAVSSGAKRLKEIGLRKAMGSKRLDIIYQFLAENALICAFSLVIGLILSYFLFLPGFNELAPVELPFEFSSWQNALLFFLSVWLMMVLVAGAYPALYISKYQASVIFGGKQKLKSKNYLSKSLLTLQLFLAFTTVVASFVFTDNAMYVKELEWGYYQNGLMSIRLPNETSYEELKTEMIADPFVESVAGSKGHIGVDNPLIDFEFLDKQFRAIVYDVSSDYLQTLQFNTIDGELFHADHEVDEESVVINELFAEKMGWSDPVGHQFDYDGKTLTVIGLIGNARHAFFSADELRPMLFTNKNEGYNFLTIRYNGEDFLRIEEKLKEAQFQLTPNDPFSVFYQDQIFNDYYNNVDANIKLMLFIGVIAILLSCLGLYGLVSYMIQTRIKEFGIRKVLGAEKKHMVLLTAKEYLWIMVISFGLGVPMSVYGVHSTVTSLFSIAKPFSILPVLIALVVTLLAIILTVMKEMVMLIGLNPVETLRE